VVNSSDIMTVKLRYKKPDEDVSKLIVQKIKENDRKTKNTENFTFASAVAEFGMLLRASEFKANSSYSNVLALATAAKGIDKEGYRSEFMKLVETADLLNK
jgi:Ca-activated chloride channel family protein